MDGQHNNSENTITSPLLANDSVQSNQIVQTYFDRLGTIISESCKKITDEIHTTSFHVRSVQDSQILQMGQYTKEIHEAWKKSLGFFEFMKDIRYDEEHMDGENIIFLTDEFHMFLHHYNEI